MGKPLRIYDSDGREQQGLIVPSDCPHYYKMVAVYAELVKKEKPALSKTLKTKIPNGYLLSKLPDRYQIVWVGTNWEDTKVRDNFLRILNERLQSKLKSFSAIEIEKIAMLLVARSENLILDVEGLLQITKFEFLMMMVCGETSITSKVDHTIRDVNKVNLEVIKA